MIFWEDSVETVWKEKEFKGSGVKVGSKTGVSVLSGSRRVSPLSKIKGTNEPLGGDNDDSKKVYTRRHKDRRR